MDFSIEKQYIIKLLFNNLQLDVPEEVGLDKNYKFRYENKVLEINDSFFSRIPASDSYLKRENIPDEVIWIDDHFPPLKPLFWLLRHLFPYR